MACLPLHETKMFMELVTISVGFEKSQNYNFSSPGIWARQWGHFPKWAGSFEQRAVKISRYLTFFFQGTRPQNKKEYQLTLVGYLEGNGSYDTQYIHIYIYILAWGDFDKSLKLGNDPSKFLFSMQYSISDYITSESAFSCHSFSFLAKTMAFKFYNFSKNRSF